MLRFWREGMILALATLSYFLYHTRPSADCPPIPAVTHEKVEVNQTVTTTTTKPDGTKVKKVVVTEKTTKEKSKPSEKVIEAQAAQRKSQYDIHFTHDGSSFHSVGVGARLGELPAFGTLDYEIPTNSVLVGLRVEF